MLIDLEMLIAKDIREMEILNNVQSAWQSVQWLYNIGRKELIQMPKTERIDIRISPELKQQLQQAADAENRTVSNYIVNLIQKDIKERGGN